MFLFLSALSVLSLSVAAAMPLYLKKSGEYRILFLTEAALSLLGLLGSGGTALVLTLLCRGTPEREYGTWAEDHFFVYAGLLLIPVAAVLLVVLLTALLTPGKFRVIRGMLPPFAAAALLAATSILAYTAVNDGAIPVDRYLSAFALFLSLLFHLRGCLENGLYYRFLLRTNAVDGSPEQRKKSRKKKH